MVAVTSAVICGRSARSFINAWPTPVYAVMSLSGPVTQAQTTRQTGVHEELYVGVVETQLCVQRGGCFRVREALETIQTAKVGLDGFCDGFGLTNGTWRHAVERSATREGWNVLQGSECQRAAHAEACHADARAARALCVCACITAFLALV